MTTNNELNTNIRQLTDEELKHVSGGVIKNDGGTGIGGISGSFGTAAGSHGTQVLIGGANGIGGTNFLI